MNKDEINLSLLEEKIATILQETTFLLVEPIQKSEKDKKISPLSHTVSIEYDGLHKGKIFIKAEEEFIKNIAFNMLALNKIEDVTLQQAIDSFKEIGNILTGRILPLLYRNNGECHIYPPSYSHQLTDKENSNSFYTFIYDCEGMLVEINISLIK